MLVPLALAGTVVTAGADEHPASTGGVDEEAMVRRIVQEVVGELERSGLLQEQIQRGIEDYVARQQAARARAQAGRGRAASRRAESVRRVDATRDHVYGKVGARVSLIEYSDFECPFCKRFHPTAKEVVDGSEGTVNWVYRHFPLAFHNPLAQKEAEASECAADIGGNAAFWRYADALYERTRSNGNGFPIDGLVPLAEELGLDRRRFAECFESERFARRVTEDFEEGQSIGIAGTPGNVLLDNETGRVRVVSGAVPAARLRSEIDLLLAGSQ